ncbi:MAG: MBL fold metallo-hydrolase [Alphaproteobacteria bacterium]
MHFTACAAPSPAGGEYIRYGGNTSCLEIRCRPHLIILDAGTGLRPLGVELTQNGKIDADLLLSHTHIDHIAGLPFFVPLFMAGNKVRLWAGHLADHTENLRQVIKRMMAAPLFPIPIEALSAEIDFRDFKAGDAWEMKPGVMIRTAPLNHPNGATGYRIEYGGRSVCYVTDTEHVEGELDRNILRLIDGSDVFIYDSTYTDDEYPRYRGWGHSTWQQGVRLADAAKAKLFIVFHHAPEHDDDTMDEIGAAVRRARPASAVAHEGMIIKP